MAGTVRIWDTSNGRRLHALSGHSSKVILLAFSSEGTRIASATADLDVRIWEVNSGKSIAVVDPDDPNSRNENNSMSNSNLESRAIINSQLYFGQDASRVYVRSALGTVSWRVDSMSENEPRQSDAPHFESHLRGEGSLEIPKQSKPKVIIRKGFFRFGDRSTSFALLFIIFEREGKWEFIALPTQEVGNFGLVAIHGQRVAISTPMEREKILLLEISKSKSPVRTPVFIGYDTGTLAFQSVKSDELEDGWHVSTSCQWERAIDDLVLHQSPTFHCRRREENIKHHVAWSELYTEGSIHLTTRVRNDT